MSKQMGALVAVVVLSMMSVAARATSIPPTLAVSASIKQLHFSWPSISGATSYRLMQGSSETTTWTPVSATLGAGATSASVDITVHELDWLNALYRLDVCAGKICSSLPAVSVTSKMLDAIGYFKASNTGAEDRFGHSVALSADGTTMAVGAPGEDSFSFGVNGPSNDLLPSAGAVYVFVRHAGQWLQQAFVKASNTGQGHGFGDSVALSADGSTLAVGAATENNNATGVNGNQYGGVVNVAGAVYIFKRAQGQWSQQAYVKASNTGAGDHFGYSIALADDGRTLAVGAVTEDSHATGIDGDQGSDGAGYSGAAYVFRGDGMQWWQDAYVKASNTGSEDRFGESVALSGDGKTLAVGATFEDSNATGINGSQANGASNSGAVYVYTRDSAWTQQAYVKACNTRSSDLFGYSVDLNFDGSTLAVGAVGSKRISCTGTAENALVEGAVHVFTRSGTQWSQQAFLKGDMGEWFGFSVALDSSGNKLAVATPSDDYFALGVADIAVVNGADDSGAVYTFARNDAAWSQPTYIKASNTEMRDYLSVVAMSGDGGTLAVAAPREDSQGNRVGADQSDNGAPEAGAVYLY